MKSQRNSARPKMPPVSEEMREWSALLEREVLGWPGVDARPMFGFKSLYRNNVIFAALPRSRGLMNSSSFIFKLDPVPAALAERVKGESRIDNAQNAPGKRWFSFQLNSSDDLRDALWWLDQAYQNAKARSGKFTKRHKSSSVGGS